MVSFLTQLTFKLMENMVLNKISSSIKAAVICLKSPCCRRRNDENEDRDLEAQITVITSRAADNNICHLHECQFVRRMRAENKVEWTACRDCRNYLKEESRRIARSAAREAMDSL